MTTWLLILFVTSGPHEAALVLGQFDIEAACNARAVQIGEFPVAIGTRREGEAFCVINKAE